MNPDYMEFQEELDQLRADFETDLRLVRDEFLGKFEQLERRLRDKQAQGSQSPAATPRAATTSPEASNEAHSTSPTDDNSGDSVQEDPVEALLPTGSDDTNLLPFALEGIASKIQSMNTAPELCQKCGDLKGLPSCFRDGHFRWCVTHDVLTYGTMALCGGGSGCKIVEWKVVPNWKKVVNKAFATGNLGHKGVKNLNWVLFPED